jgi:mRNA-degrading endonuclease RelE of RelBE toxin-antitoxin system
MRSYRFTRTPKFDERLSELDPVLQKRILRKLKEFILQVNDYGIDPRLHSNTKYITEKRTWRLRIGKYRLFFDILEDEIRFTTILHRERAYQ